MTSAILVTLTVALLALRYLRIAAPLFQFIPPRFRWVPSAVAAAATVLQVQLPNATSVEDYTAAVLAGVVAFALAAQAGTHSPEAV